MNEKHLKNWLNERKKRRKNQSADVLLNDLKKGHIETLSHCITLLESSLQSDKLIANELIRQCLPLTGNAIRIGITGVPGVGKSTFIESFGKQLILEGKKIAVLAIDPSSSTTGGSILGDKTRMTELASMPHVFIRPSAAGNTLGGVARKTRESIFLCEAAGFDCIIIETVGVGQSETIVHSMVDFFLLLMLSGAGDELQGIKRGIMEMADALVITKADGDNIKKAELASREYANAMHLFHPKQSQWTPPALTCSSLENDRIHTIWEVIEEFEHQTKENGWFKHHRKLQDIYWLGETLKEKILNDFYSNEKMKNLLQEKENEVLNGEISSFQAADELYEKFQTN